MHGNHDKIIVLNIIIQDTLPKDYVIIRRDEIEDMTASLGHVLQGDS